MAPMSEAKERLRAVLDRMTLKRKYRKVIERRMKKMTDIEAEQVAAELEKSMDDLERADREAARRLREGYDI